MVSNNSKERSTNLTNEEVRKLIKYKLEAKIAQLPYGFWRCDRGKDHSRIAIKYLIEEHLKLDMDDVPKVMSAKTFHEAGLFRILVEFFDSSYYKALEYTYPGYFHPWEFQNLEKYKIPFYMKRNTGLHLEKNLKNYLSWCLKKNFRFISINDYLNLRIC